MKRYSLDPRSGCRTRGFSLLEVLITILIMAIGLLGMAALQAVSMRSNQSANFRTQATALAYMIIDRMRANGDAILRGEYLAGMQAASCGGAPAQTPIATHDVELWRQQIACQLPEGQGAIEFQGDGVHVQIKWTDARWSLVPSERSTTFELVTKL